jgi:AraC family transcriptional regulator, regulatory protein of adaptative response / methylated-DNA-[protein]-cysteine methyltransferase
MDLTKEAVMISVAMPALAPDRFDPDALWRAVRDRDHSPDGSFLYAVKTTGVYCRPSCPSRRPRRENVEFFADPESARARGFRACLRCRPDESAPRDPVAEAHRYLLDHPTEGVTLDRLARTVELSPSHLHRRFKARYGLSPKELAATRRTDRLKAALKRGTTVSRATYDAGFGSGSRVYERADTRLGMSPGRYARGGSGLAIRYTIVPSPLGPVLIGVTDRGVASVSVGATDAGLERGLRAEFPRATLARVDDGRDPWLTGLVGQVAARLAGGAVDRSIPLELVGTAFQYRVWRALLEIPSGSTRSYAAVARAIGRPGSARAVARAVGKNRIAVVVPCHRVIREDGTLGGYRWGVAAKQALLDRESEGRPA